MTDFARVNNGIAFSGPFTVQNANDLRTNGELLWLGGINYTKLGKITPPAAGLDDPLLFGAPSWSAAINGFVNFSLDLHTNVCMSTFHPAGDATTLLCEPGGGFTPPMVFYVESTGYYYAMFDGNITSSTTPWDLMRVARLSTGSPWSPLRVCAPCKMTDSIWVLPLGNSTPVYPYLPYSTLTGEAGICRITAGAAGALTSATIGTISGSSYPTTSIASNGTRAIAVNQSSATSLTCTTTGAVATFSVATHASADRSMQAVAYDPRLAKFVLLMPGVSSGAYPTNLMWTTSVDGTTWSASSGWYRFAPPWAEDTVLEDFTITRDGVWLAICRTLHSGTSYDVYFRHLLTSIDSGANWAVTLIGIFDTTVTGVLGLDGFRFGSINGDGWCAIRQNPTGPDLITGTTASIGSSFAAVSV